MEVLSIAEFIKVLNGIFSELGMFALKGEVSQLKYSKNNAVFIDLKDKTGNALIRISNFAPRVSGITAISEGMEVIVEGYLEIYAPTGSLNFKALKIKPIGEGSLKQAYENLKLALESEGLFAPDRKRELPLLIQRIALITGKNSAAYSDFTKILQENASAIQIDFYPVLVQGSMSEEEITAAFEHAVSQDFDLIVLIRGGGSLEDLAAFNSEKIARAIFKSRIPVVVGVGHEIDTTIADLVADLRASTPSQAAYYIHSQNQSYISNLDAQVELIHERLNEEFAKIVEILQITNNIENILMTKVDKLISKTDNIFNLLTAYNPLNVLARGYALISSNSHYISSIKELTKGKAISIKLKDGTKSNIIIN